MFMYTKTFPSAGHVAVKLLPSIPCYTSRITDRSYRRPRKKNIPRRCKTTVVHSCYTCRIAVRVMFFNCSINYLCRPWSRSTVGRIVFAGHGRVGQVPGDVAPGRLPRRRIHRFVFPPFPVASYCHWFLFLLLVLTYLYTT